MGNGEKGEGGGRLKKKRRGWERGDWGKHSRERERETHEVMVAKSFQCFP